MCLVEKAPVQVRSLLTKDGRVVVLSTVEPLLSDPHETGSRSEHKKSRKIREARKSLFKSSLCTALILLEKHVYKTNTVIK